MSIPRDEWGQLREDVGYVKRHIEDAVRISNDHETRIRGLEVWRNRVAGGLGLVVFLAGLLGVLFR